MLMFAPNGKICVGQKRCKHPRRAGWVVVANLYKPKKKDGTVDKRATARTGKHSLHIHRNGHKRWYVGGVLRSEKYILKSASKLNRS